MSLAATIDKLEKNPINVYEEVIRLLIKIIDNILADPNNIKVRTLKRNNPTVSNKILNVHGGPECLKVIGFQEKDEYFTLPAGVSLEALESFKQEIIMRKKYAGSNNKGAISKINVEKKVRNNVHQAEEFIKKVTLPPFETTYHVPFLREIAFRFHLAQIHDNKYLQARAKEAIPVRKLESAAISRLRILQRDVKKGVVQDFGISPQDMLILELLNWFKNDFFTWVDNPPCKKCGGDTVFSEMSSDPNDLLYTDRVELHKCQSCNCSTAFPRFNDLNILLETRRGRCGEWANVFTLMCRAMNWDARHVFDEADHVWTEVYSFAQRRWIHCDPCDNACDTPLMYESGWNKEISYIIAYSGEEVQDVTWRYSSDHKKVMERRTKCNENELIDALVSLRTKRQEVLSIPRRKYLTRRLVDELCDLMLEKKPNDKDRLGRTSGSVAWRLYRGEYSDEIKSVSHVWTISVDNNSEDVVNIKYSTALDTYELVRKCADGQIMKGWQNGAFKVCGLYRKEEKDWKMVYLARREGVNEGNVIWKFKINDVELAIDAVRVKFCRNIYENGKVDVALTGGSKEVHFDDEQDELETKEFSGSRTIKLSAILTGGKGNVAWQHAQVFRQPADSEEYPFQITFTLKKI